MPRWIDATPAQRTAIYIRPAAVKELAGYEAFKDEFRAEFRKLRDAHYADLTDRRARRRVRQAMDQWKLICEHERYLRSVVGA
jgi:hypothetical protein